MFAPKYTITNKLLAQIKRVYALIEELNKRRFSRVVLVELEKTARVLSSYASTSIEGNQLPLTEVKKVLKSAPVHIRTSEQEVLNYNQALTTLNQKLNTGNIVLSLDLILHTHQQVMRDLLPDFESGRLRQKPVMVNDPRTRQVVYLPPDASDVTPLIDTLITFLSENRQAIDPLILAGIFHKQFVIIHPFMDGNGRIHRYLIHEVLAHAGFTPRGIILPVSAVILANPEDYVAVLEAFSRPIQAMTHYNPDAPDIPATGNDAVYFRYFDATPQAEFLYQALVRTVEEDLGKEIDYLLGFDRAYTALNGMLDWPAHSLELFIHVVRQNNGTLSRTKRDSHFRWMQDDEINKAEQAVVEAFDRSM